jgi:hypothetical protein
MYFNGENRYNASKGHFMKTDKIILDLLSQRMHQYDIDHGLQRDFLTAQKLKQDLDKKERNV